MATTNLSLNQPAYNSSAWDVPLNANETILDNQFAATTSIALTNTNVTLTSPNTSGTGQTQAMRVVLTGSLSANVQVIIPSGISGSWIIYNTTSGAYTVTIASGGGGASVVAPQGYNLFVYSDGTNVRKSDDGVIGSASIVNTFSAGTTGLTPSTATSGAVTLAGTLAVANGGTGITSLGTGVQTALGNTTNAASGLVTLNGSGQLPAVSGALLTNLPATGLGIGQTLQNVTSSRSSGTTYTNSTSSPILVMVTLSGGGTNYTIGGVTMSGGQTGSTGYTWTLTFVVPAGFTYSVGGSITSWAELR